MKAIIFSFWFEAPAELDAFCQSIGYVNPNYRNNFDLMFDQRVVEFCEARLSEFNGRKIYKGTDSRNFLVGFAGAGYVYDIDTTKKWTLLRESSRPVINYCTVSTDKYGQIIIKPDTTANNLTVLQPQHQQKENN